MHPYLNTHLTKLYFEIALGQFYNSTINIFGFVKLRVLDNLFVSKGLEYHCWRIHLIMIYLFHDMMMDIFIWRQVRIFLFDF